MVSVENKLNVLVLVSCSVDELADGCGWGRAGAKSQSQEKYICLHHPPSPHPLTNSTQLSSTTNEQHFVCPILRKYAFLLPNVSKTNKQQDSIAASHLDTLPLQINNLDVILSMTCLLYSLAPGGYNSFLTQTFLGNEQSNTHF